jgi:hypothetical protein
VNALNALPILLLATGPCIGAGKPPSITLTQVDESGSSIGGSRSASCDSSGCRQIIPVLFHQKACVVNVQISLPERLSFVELKLSLMSCWPARPSTDMVLDQGAWRVVKLGPHRAFTEVVCLHLGRAMNDFAPSEYQTSFVRVDAVYP